MELNAWQTLFAQQKDRYPLARMQDLLKALHQSALGCGHLVENEAGSFERLKKEWPSAPAAYPPEPLAGGFSRLHLGQAREAGLDPRTVQRLFTLSARVRTGQEAVFADILREIRECPEVQTLFADDADRAFLDGYIPRAPALLSHSDIFRENYRPAYRVISDDLISLLPLCARIDRALAASEKPLVMAVEGGCAGGKSTAAGILAAVYGAPVIHMDDFFLRPEQRTEDRYRTPGGNVDHERFLLEAAPFLRAGQAFSYRKFDCARMALGESVSVPASRLTVVEGSYSMHPALSSLYGLSVFIETDLKTRKKRILRRNGDRAEQFFTRWMPLEDLYFDSTAARQRCSMSLSFPDTPWNVLDFSGSGADE